MTILARKSTRWAVAIVLIVGAVLVLVLGVFQERGFNSGKNIYSTVWDIAYADDRLAIGYVDGTIWLFDLAEKRQTQLRHEDAGSNLVGVEFVPNSPWLIAAFERSKLIVFDIDNNLAPRTYDNDDLPDIFTLAISPDGHYVVTAWQGIAVFGLSDTGELIDNDLRYAPWKYPRRSTVDMIFHMAFSPDSQTLVTNDATINKIYTWDTATFTPNLLVRSAALSLNYAPHANELVAAHGDKTIRVWDMDSRTATLEISESGDVTHIAFLGDQPAFVAAFRDGRVNIYDSATGDVLKALPGNGERIWSFAVLSNGRFIVLGYDSGEVKVWDLEDDSQLLSFEAFLARY